MSSLVQKRIWPSGFAQGNQYILNADGNGPSSPTLDPPSTRTLIRTYLRRTEFANCHVFRMMAVLGGCQQHNNLRMKYEEGKLSPPSCLKPLMVLHCAQSEIWIKGAAPFVPAELFSPFLIEIQAYAASSCSEPYTHFYHKPLFLLLFSWKHSVHRSPNDQQSPPSGLC